MWPVQPPEDNFLLQCTLKGIRRVHGDRVVHKTAYYCSSATPHLQHTTPSSNVLSEEKSCWSTKCLKRQNVHLYHWGMLLHISHTKTIQFKERSLDIPVPRQKGSTLWSVQAIFHTMHSRRCCVRFFRTEIRWQLHVYSSCSNFDIAFVSCTCQERSMVDISSGEEDHLLLSMLGSTWKQFGRLALASEDVQAREGGKLGGWGGGLVRKH